MSVIQYVFWGHQFRYYVESGRLENNYGTHVSTLIVDRENKTLNLKMQKRDGTSSIVSITPFIGEPTDADLARFCIWITESHLDSDGFLRRED